MRKHKNTVKSILLSLVIILLVFQSNGCQKNQTGVGEYFPQLIKLLPASVKNSGGIVLIDYEKALQNTGVMLFSSDGGKLSLVGLDTIIKTKYKEGLGDELTCFTIGSYYTGHGSNMFKSSINEENVGYGFSDVKAEVFDLSLLYIISDLLDTSHFSNDGMIAAIGQFNANISEKALLNQSKWPTWARDSYKEEKYKEIQFFTWGNTDSHTTDRFLPPNLDQMGRATPFAISDNHLLIGSSTDSVKSMIDVSENNIQTLADVPEYSMAVQGMVDLGASMAIIMDESLVNLTSTNSVTDESPLLRYFSLCGTGLGHDNIGDYIAMVLVHNTELDAQENASLLEKRITTSSFPNNGGSTVYSATWSKGADIFSGVKIHTSGKIVTAKLYTEDKGLWYRWFSFHGNLLLH